MSCCTLAPGKLLRCGACDSAWYCNVDCQRNNFKEHKPMCKALRLFRKLQADLAPESWPSSAEDYYTQRSNCQRILEPMLRRPLSRTELRAILGEAKCAVCMRTRTQLARLGRQAAAAAATATAAAAGTSGAAGGAQQPDADCATAVAAVTLPGSACSGSSTVASTTPSSAVSSSSAAAALSTGEAAKAGDAAQQPRQAEDAASVLAANEASAAGTRAVTGLGPEAARSGSAPGSVPGPGSGSGCGSGSGLSADPGSAAAAGPLAPPREDSAAAPASSNGCAPPVATTAAPDTAAPAAATAADLTCCPHCHWGWVCSAHRDAYLAEPHASVCMSYQHMNDSQLLTYRYLTATGRLPNHVPDKLRPTGQQHGSRVTGPAEPAAAAASGWEPVPAGWAAYRGWRPLPAFDQALMCLLTKRMSQALTVIQALQHHYRPQQLAAKSHLEVHVLGASSFEVPADRIWEEILNLMPPWNPQAAATDAEPPPAAAPAAPPPRRVLHVAFVGPELADIILEASDGRLLPQGTALQTCPPAEPAGRDLLYSYHLCTYQDFARGRRCRGSGDGGAASGADGTEASWRRPDLAVGFNSGMSDSDQELWAPALEVLVRHGVPVVFTSYNAEEAAADAGVWVRAGGEVTRPPERNPFRALEPIAEPSQIDVFYYQNYYWWCGRGAAPAAEGPSAAAPTAQA